MLDKAAYRKAKNTCDISERKIFTGEKISK